ncbi:serine/threonine protein kinase [Minicystis rosea]|nr:serine/threonine protein kinase [Minicystis rosea]
MSRKAPPREPARLPSSGRSRDGDTLPESISKAISAGTVETSAGDTEPIEPRALPEALAEADLLSPESASPWHRYEDLGPIGMGGGGEVRRVRDRLMDRTLAMKILRADAAASPVKRARFLAEARLSARLQHPGIVPIHDCGAMPDGRLWFTMTEVRGQTLRRTIDAAYAAEPSGLSPVELRRLVEVYARACEAVAYAHRQGVVHRDLKPDNVLVGGLGEVYVVDWGLARPLDELDTASGMTADASRRSARFTLTGSIVGTPAYMAPEQARGETARIGTPSDVYALGAVLYEILCGARAYEGTARVVLSAVASGPPPSLSDRGRTPPPEELSAICERAMARAMEERFPHAGALATEVRGFLDGVQRRARAIALVREAEAIAPRAAARRTEAAALRARADADLARLQTWDPVEEKARSWAREDEAREKEVSAAVEQVAWEAKIHSALTEAPELVEAHEALAAEHARELSLAEATRDAEAAARAEALLWLHDRGRFAALLGGSGTLSVATDPPGARVLIARYIAQGRRLTPAAQNLLGESNLHDVSLRHGSYLVTLAAPGFREARYPVHLGRGQHWDDVPPGANGESPSSRAIPLLREDTLDAGDVYVPQGWYRAGGDRLAAESLPAQRIWVEGFVMQRHPVTVAAYLAFLNDLVAHGRKAEADVACPSIPSSMAGGVKVPLYGRDAQGLFHAPETSLDEPAVSMTWHGAMAYAAWFAARTGKPWRLPSELEREKAARGVDGRHYPWGDHPESTWANVAGSAPGSPKIAPIGAHALDESPYGILGLAGNTRDWCIDVWTPSGPLVEHGTLRIHPASAEDPALRSIRGGAWTWSIAMCRTAARLAARPDEHGASLGLRLVRGIAEPS